MPWIVLKGSSYYYLANTHHNGSIQNPLLNTATNLVVWTKPSPMVVQQLAM